MLKGVRSLRFVFVLLKCFICYLMLCYLFYRRGITEIDIHCVLFYFSFFLISLLFYFKRCDVHISSILHEICCAG